MFLANYQKYSLLLTAQIMFFHVSNVLKMDFRNLDRSTIDKVVRGLAKRKFTYRVVEEEETENVV